MLMTPTIFVEEIEKLVPSKQMFLDAGLSENLFETIKIRHASALKRDRPQSLQGYNGNDPLIELILSYDVTSLDIINIYLYGEVYETEKFYSVGDLDGDLLCVCKETRETIVVDQTDYGNILWKCARNSNKLMQNMLLLTDFIMRSFIDNSIRDDAVARNTVVQKCIENAGGEEYANFYKTYLLD